MEFLDEFQAERVCGGRRPLAFLLRGVLGFNGRSGLGRSGGGFGRAAIGSMAIDTTVNQINLAFNIVLNGGSIVNNQLNGLDLSVTA